MSHDYRYGRPSIDRIRMRGSRSTDTRYAILVAIRCPSRFIGCRSHGMPVHRQYWNGYKEGEE